MNYYPRIKAGTNLIQQNIEIYKQLEFCDVKSEIVVADNEERKTNFFSSGVEETELKNEDGAVYIKGETVVECTNENNDIVSSFVEQEDPFMRVLSEEAEHFTNVQSEITPNEKQENELRRKNGKVRRYTCSAYGSSLGKKKTSNINCQISMKAEETLISPKSEIFKQMIFCSKIKSEYIVVDDVEMKIDSYASQDEKTNLENADDVVYIKEEDPLFDYNDILTLCAEQKKPSIHDLSGENDFNDFKFKIQSKAKERNKLVGKREGGRRFSCSECEKYFGKKADLVWHIQEIHGILRPHKCPFCESSFCFVSKLTRHIKLVHEKLKPYSCTICERAFALKENLMQHIESVHIKLKPHKCFSCEGAFSRRSDLVRHIQVVHVRLKPFKCAMCESAFSQNRYLTKHIHSVHDKILPHKCPQCERSFAQKYNLTSHIQSVHEKLRPYNCTICGSVFTQKIHLSSHVQSVHEKLKPYTCTVCENSFYQRQHLINHIRSVHEKLRPYQCNVCEKAFSRRGNLTQHKLSHEKLN